MQYQPKQAHWANKALQGKRAGPTA